MNAVYQSDCAEVDQLNPGAAALPGLGALSCGEELPLPEASVMSSSLFNADAKRKAMPQGRQEVARSTIRSRQAKLE